MDECEDGGQICASGICCGCDGYEPVTYGNVNRTLFSVTDRFWRNVNATKEVKNEVNA